MGYADKANEPPIELAPIVETQQPSEKLAAEEQEEEEQAEQQEEEPKMSAEEEAEVAEQARLAKERSRIEQERAEAEKREISPPRPFSRHGFLSASPLLKRFLCGPGAGRKRSPIKFDDDDAGNEFVVSDGSTALIKDYMDHPDNCQGLESMQITFKSPGSFKRVDSLGETQESQDGDSYQTVVTQTDTSPGRFQDSRGDIFDTSPVLTRNPAPAASGPAGVNFSPSVFLRNTPRAVHARSPMQMVDGFAVPSPFIQSGKKKRGWPSSATGSGGSANKPSAESVRKRAASMPAAHDSADSSGAVGPSPMRRSFRSLTPESSFELGASAGFSDERIGILSPSDGEIELTGRESLGTVVSLRVSAGTTPSPALKKVMQSIARQSGIFKKSIAAKSSAPAACSTAGSMHDQTSPNPKVAEHAGSDCAPATNLERDKIFSRASSMPDAERGVLSVNLAASKFSPPHNPEAAQEQRSQRTNARQLQQQQDEQAGTALSPASFYRSATGHTPYQSGAERAAKAGDFSPSNSSSPASSMGSSSPTSSPGAPSPTYEERQAAAARDRSLVPTPCNAYVTCAYIFYMQILHANTYTMCKYIYNAEQVDQLVQPIAQPISQEWTKSPAPTAW